MKEIKGNWRDAIIKKNIPQEGIFKKIEEQKMYLDYVNNFLTVKRFAEHYGISIEKANKTIEIGRKHQNKRK